MHIDPFYRKQFVYQTVVIVFIILYFLFSNLFPGCSKNEESANNDSSGANNQAVVETNPYKLKQEKIAKIVKMRNEAYNQGRHFEEQGMPDRALEVYTENAALNDFECMYNAGRIYESGYKKRQDGCDTIPEMKPDYTKALEFYEESVSIPYESASQSHYRYYIPAKMKVATMHEKGIGTKKDSLFEAETRYSQLEDVASEHTANPEHAKEALKEIKRFRQEKEEKRKKTILAADGMKGNTAKRLALYIKASNEGDCEGSYKAGLMYEAGYGSNGSGAAAETENSDIHKAVEMYRKTLQQTDPENKETIDFYIMANTKMGMMYETGTGATKNYFKALDYYNKVTRCQYGNINLKEDAYKGARRMEEKLKEYNLN